MSNHHIENATSWLNATIVDTHDTSPAGQRLRAELAQAHATLAVAHELRTANLIAFSTVCENSQISDSGTFAEAAARLNLGDTK